MEERGSRMDMPLKPQVVVRAVNEFLTDDTIVCCDTGTVTTWVARHIKMKDQMEFSASGTLATMGNGLPYSLGAGIAHPGRQIVCIAGDGGFTMLMGELATGLLERLGERGYQLCVIDPEGDYENFPQAIVLGTAQDGPSHAEILTALANPNNHVVVNLVGLPLQDRPSFFLTLLPKLQELRSKSGRPHWMLVDETHHLLPVDGNPTTPGLMKDLAGMIYVTVHPDHIEHSILKTVDIVFALGKSPDETLKQYCAAIQQPAPAATAARLQPGRAIMWNRASGETPFVLEIAPSTIERRRHRRKYAEGELPPEQSFYFRGPAGQLNLRAHTLLLSMRSAKMSTRRHGSITSALTIIRPRSSRLSRMRRLRSAYTTWNSRLICPQKRAGN